MTYGHRLTVDTATVASQAARVHGEAAELESRLASLQVQMAELATSWTGAASVSFHELYASWSGAAETMKQSLTAIGVSLARAGQDYESLEASLASSFRS